MATQSDLPPLLKRSRTSEIIARSPVLQFPAEVWLQIMSYLPISTWSNLFRACRTLSNLTCLEDLWKKLDFSLGFEMSIVAFFQKVQPKVGLFLATR